MRIRFCLITVTLAAAGLAQPPAQQPPRKPPAAPANPTGTMDSLSNSLQDLNAIRDGNLNRVQKDGCSAETAARLTELRGKLRQLDTESVDAPALAADWFKPAPVKQEEQSERENRLLDAVLPGTVAAPAKPAVQRPKANEEELARLRSEFARLSAACAAVRRQP
jgi:hypothetical protein